jgi:hypothetical protein
VLESNRIDLTIVEGMKMRNLIIVLAALLLTACDDNPFVRPQTQQQQIQNVFDSYSAKTKALNEKNENCKVEMKKNESVRIVEKEIIFLEKNDTNRYALMTSKQKLNDQHKKLFNEYLIVNQKCRNDTAELLKGMPYENAIAESFSDLDIIYVQLLDDKITIGDANTQKLKILDKQVAEVSSQHNAYIQKLNDAMKDANSADLERRQRAAAILAPYLMNNKPYQLPMPSAPKPISNPTINTQCTTNGNQVNCTSY